MERILVLQGDSGVKLNYAKFQYVKVINSKGKEVKRKFIG